MLVILVYLSPYMTSIMLICNIPVIFYFSFALGRSKTYQEEIQDIKAECSVIAEETFSNVKTVKAFATEKYESDRFNDKNCTVFNTQHKQTLLWNGFGFTFQFCIYFS